MLGSHIACFCFGWSLMTICMLPIAGRLLTDSVILHCYCSFSSSMVLQIGDFDSSVLPIAGRPATIK